MEVTSFQTFKLIIISVTGLSRDALHIYTGLGTMLMAALILRRSPGHLVPWLIAVLVCSLGEAIDMYDDIALRGYWRWPSSLHDFLNTLFWPTVIFLLARYTRLFTLHSKKR